MGYVLPKYTIQGNDPRNKGLMYVLFLGTKSKPVNTTAPPGLSLFCHNFESSDAFFVNHYVSAFFCNTYKRFYMIVLILSKLHYFNDMFLVEFLKLFFKVIKNTQS